MASADSTDDSCSGCLAPDKLALGPIPAHVGTHESPLDTGVPMATTMRAYGVDELGMDTSAVHEVPVPVPVPTDRCLVVCVACASINPVDWKSLEGQLGRLLRPRSLPYVPSMDFSGTVHSVGPLCSRGLQPGDAVMGMCLRSVYHTGCGAFAEYVHVAEDEVVRIPRGLSLAEAAAVPLCGLTAWQALVGKAGHATGSEVLLNAGSGGVGSFAVAKRVLGASLVCAIASKRSHEYLKSLGADVMVERRPGAVLEARGVVRHGYAVVLDCVGSGAESELLLAMAPGGTFVTVVGCVPGKVQAQEHGVSCHKVFVKPNAGQLGKLASMLAAKELALPRIEVVPMTSVRDALLKSKSGSVTGKLVASWTEV
eukprot:m51a1_g10224 hypothetical protein (369) ;mRNA; f:135487-136756